MLRFNGAPNKMNLYMQQTPSPWLLGQKERTEAQEEEEEEEEEEEVQSL
jgi:hypothetical protein